MIDALCVTDLPLELFQDKDSQSNLIHQFEYFGLIENIIWLRYFRRLIIVFTDPSVIPLVKANSLHVNGHQLGLYTLQIPSLDSHPEGNHHRYLEPPEHDRMFLISPPSSPPFGWTQVREQPPVRADKLPVDDKPHDNNNGDEFLRMIVHQQLSALHDRNAATGQSCESLSEILMANAHISPTNDDEMQVDRPDLPKIVIDDWDMKTFNHQSSTTATERIPPAFVKQIPRTRMPAVQ